MITYQQETWDKFQPDFERLCVRHWEEIAHNKDLIPLSPDWNVYQGLANAGMLHATAAREEGELVGYQIYIVTPHPHYKTSLTANSDVLYLAPERRQGMTGIKLMKAAEANLKAIGVQRVLQNVKFSNDWGAILDRMGYSPFERIYSKILGD